MKLSVLFSIQLLAGGTLAAVVRPRSPQAPGTGSPPTTPKTGKSKTGGKGFPGLLGGGVMGKLAGSVLPTAKYAGQTTLPPRIRPNAKRIVAKYGPYSMKGKGEKKPKESFSLDPNGQGFVNVITAGLCSQCTILAGQTGMTFTDGKPAGPDQGMYIHHILSTDLSKEGVMPVRMCDMNTVNTNISARTPYPGAGFIGQGEDNGDQAIMFTSADGKYNSGFHVRTADRFMLWADLVNYNNATKDIYITFDIEYVDGIVGEDATPNLLSVTGCRMAAPKTDPNGPAVTQSKKFPVLVDGTIISAKGHMHNGGESMTLGLNGKEICVSKPRYENEQIVGMSGCNLAVPVKRGDYVTMSSTYDLKSHTLRKGVDGGHAHDVMGGMDVMCADTQKYGFQLLT